jgi:hypothetical protein
MDEIFDALGVVLDAIMGAVGELGPGGSFMLVGTSSVVLVWMVSRAMRS